jgi:hypothetical protein
MVINTPDKTVLRLLWDEVAHNGRFDAIPYARCAEMVSDLESRGIEVYGASGNLPAIRSAVEREARYLASLGFVEAHLEAVELTLLGRFFAEALEYPDWVLLRIGANGQKQSTFKPA